MQTQSEERLPNEVTLIIHRIVQLKLNKKSPLLNTSSQCKSISISLINSIFNFNLIPLKIKYLFFFINLIPILF
jgi:hypothetical protein